jgi:hypothetical protein
MKKLTLIITLLSVWAITNAQVYENIMLDSATIQKHELKVTPEIEKAVVTQLKNYYGDTDLSAYPGYGIKNNEQLDNLQIGKAYPQYSIYHEELGTIATYNVSLLPDDAPLSLRFGNSWKVLFMCDEEPLTFGWIKLDDFLGYWTRLSGPGIENKMERLLNYEHTDLIIGTLSIGTEYLIIRKEHKDIFVKVYDEATGEFFKNEYTFSEIITHAKELDLRRKEAQMRYYEKVADKSNLEITPEIRAMLDSTLFSHLNNQSDYFYGITNNEQLENIQLEKPIPKYRIMNEKITFMGRWEVVVMSDGEPLFTIALKLEDDGQYIYTGGGGVEMAKLIHNYEHKDLITGFLGVRSFVGMDYLIIRKENKDIFVEVYDYATREYFKNEYSLSEVINLIKK